MDKLIQTFDKVFQPTKIKTLLEAEHKRLEVKLECEEHYAKSPIPLAI